MRYVRTLLLSLSTLRLGCNNMSIATYLWLSNVQKRQWQLLSVQWLEGSAMWSSVCRHGGKQRQEICSRWVKVSIVRPHPVQLISTWFCGIYVIHSCMAGQPFSSVCILYLYTNLKIKTYPHFYTSVMQWILYTHIVIFARMWVVLHVCAADLSVPWYWCY